MAIYRPEGDRRHFDHLSTQTSLIDRAHARIDSLPIAHLAEAGIKRDRSSYFLNIAYPSMQAMAEVTPEMVYGANQEKKSGKRMAVYVHIPFCTAECYYCHYYKQFKKTPEEVSAFLAAALQELRMHAQRFGGIEAASVYFGGGTPSYIEPAELDKFLSAVKEIITIPFGTEFSFEVHPESGSPELFEVLHKHGVNRINIGVESFNDKQLQTENRRHTAAQAETVFERARSMGFSNANLDLIYGLRGQTVEDWERNLQTIGRLQPASATMYYLRLKRGTPEYRLWKQFPETFPSDEELLLMHVMNFEHMIEGLKYIQKPVDWFIKDESLFHTYQDHNWRRSDQVELLGIGPSAYSYVNGWQYYNINDTGRYQDAIAGGQLPLWKGEHLTGEEPMRRTLMLGLKMGINRQTFRETYNVDVVDQFRADWERLASLGLVTITDESVALTYTGALFADEVGQQFYSDEMKRRMAKVDPELVSTTWPQFNP